MKSEAIRNLSLAAVLILRLGADPRRWHKPHRHLPPLPRKWPKPPPRLNRRPNAKSLKLKPKP